jgi:hypothetical protein
MAEPPSPFTDLLRNGRYLDFIREIDARGWLREGKPDLQKTIAGLHEELRSQRRPPGPTVEWLLIERLIQMRILDEKIRESLSGSNAVES